MVNVEARIKAKGKQFEISVDLDEALKVRNGDGDVTRALNSDAIYSDLNKGLRVSNDELEAAFDTTDLYKIAEKIMKNGEIQKPQEFRDAEREKKVKQVIGLILRNAVDQHGKPFSQERIKRAIDEVHFNFDNRPAEKQMKDLVEKLKTVIPISVQIKRIKLVIPARFTGQVYGIIGDYKENEEWLSNGDLQVIVALPSGMQIDFFEKLNGITHGAVTSEEINE
jgi:ribosome maturation protein SDO1